jgi:hypothetical protein
MTTLSSPNRATNLWKNRFAALAFRRVCTRMSSASPFASIGHSQCFLPQTVIPTSFRYPLLFCLGRSRGMQSAKYDPKQLTHNLTVFLADNHAPRSQQVFDICGAPSHRVARPVSARNHLARITEALQARHIDWSAHQATRPRSDGFNNLAIPFEQRRQVYNGSKPTAWWRGSRVDRRCSAKPPFPSRRRAGSHAASLRLALRPTVFTASLGLQDDLASHESLAQTRTRIVQETDILPSGM